MISTDRFWKSTLATTIFIAAVVFLLFFRGHWAMRVYWPSDDGCYVSRLGSWIGMQVEGACLFPEGNYFAPGAPFLWFPAGLLGKVIATLRHVEPQIWVVPLLALWSYFLWGAALYQLSLWIEETGVLKSLRLKHSSILALGIILCIPALYYSTHRAMMSHSAELLVSIVALRLIQKELWPRALLWCALLFFTRYNDAPILLMLAGKLLDSRPPGLSRKEKSILGAGMIGVALLVGWISLIHGYVPGFTLVTLIQEMTWEGVRSFWIGANFGIVWTAPWLIGALALGLFNWKRISWTARGACLWISAEFLLGMGWNGNGGDFGYRYLIGSYAAGICLWFELLKSDAGRLALPRVFKAVTIMNAAFLTYLLIIYKTVGGTGPHSPTVGFHNPDLLINFITAPWTRPHAFVIAFHQQLPIVTLYFSYFQSHTRLAALLGVAGVNRMMLFGATIFAMGYSGTYLVQRFARLPRGRKRTEEDLALPDLVAELMRQDAMDHDRPGEPTAIPRPATDPV